ncbi:MAG: hypothetical protein ACKVG0_10920, partial [Alphaproteobacteria bacterium]
MNRFGLTVIMAAALAFGCSPQTPNQTPDQTQDQAQDQTPDQMDAQPRYQPSSVRPPFDQVEINTTDLGNNIYMLDGEGANITVAVGGDGVIMVDTEFAQLNEK